MNGFDLAIVAVTGLMMVSVGMSLDRPGLASLRHRPWLVAATLAGQILVLPGLAYAVAQGLSLTPSLAFALILLAASPVGDIVSFYTLVGRGHVPLAVALNAASCALAPVSMAFVCATLPAIANDSRNLSSPGWSLTSRVLLLALVPIAAGFAFRQLKPTLAARFLAPTARIAGIAILAVLVWALIRQRDSLALIWTTALPAVLGFLVAAIAAGLAWARLWQLPPPDALPVIVTFPVRNVGLAAAIATLTGKPDSLSLIALYFLAEVPLFLAGARFWAAGRPRDGADRAPPESSTIR